MNHKRLKQIVAIIALIAIAALIIAFFVSALFAGPGESGSRFIALLFGIITIPILAWICIFCIGRLQNKHTIAEFFPENNTDDKSNNQ